jgi:hypothetical protein
LNYGSIAILFSYIGNKQKLNYVALIYMVCTLFKNFHAALYGSLTSNYFDVSLPENFLEKFIKQEDFEDV